MSIRSTVLSEFESVAEQQNIKLAPLDDDLTLLSSGLDSLCLAVVVARLEDKLGVDPFSAPADQGRLPNTVGDFVQMYEEAVSRQAYR
jgi:acyl carrier protein